MTKINLHSFLSQKGVKWVGGKPQSLIGITQIQFLRKMCENWKTFERFNTIFTFKKVLVPVK
jgi:hypothetical protein